MVESRSHGEGASSTSDLIRRFALPVVLGILAIIAIAQNTDRVHVEFLFFDFVWPLWITLLVFMAIGAALFYGFTRWRAHRS